MVSGVVAEGVGPLPEGPTVAEVHVHRAADALVPGLLAALASSCGRALRVLSGSCDDVFLGDRAPLAVRRVDGGGLVRFLSPSGMEPWSFLDDGPGPSESVVPLLLERGAILCTGERLLVSDAALERNQRPPDDGAGERLRALGWRPRSPEVVKALLAEGLGRPRRDFVFVPAMPGDATAHVCSWVLSLEEALVVPELDQEAFDAIGLVHEVALGRLVQTFLDVQAAALEERGFVVERLPMMPPTNLVRAQHRDESWLGVCSSPTGGVLLDVDGRRTALLPRPSAEGFPGAYRAALARALDAWRARFERAGFDVVFLDDEGVKARGGSLRRLVATFPPLA